MIYLGADHRGFELKEKVKAWLIGQNMEFDDLGNTKYDLTDDYPVYASAVAQKIANDPDSLGILFCGSGVGVEVVANKFDGIRAAIGKSAEQVQSGRAHDDMNILVIAAEFTREDEAKDMINAFIDTTFDKGAQHARRLQEITEIENKN